MVPATASKATDGLEGDGSNSLPELLDRSLATGVVVVDQDLDVTAVSDDARTMLGLRNGPVSFDLLPDELQKLLRNIISGSEDISPILRPASTHITHNNRRFKATITLNLDNKQRATNAIAVLQNTESLSQLEKNLRRLDRLASIGTLSASMAHEVKNALVAVQTFVDLLISQNQNAQLADIVSREMKRINSIVSQMLRFGGPARPKLGTIHIHQVLEESLNLVQHHLEGRKIQLEQNLDAVPDTVRGDAYQLEQAFINLLFNALDAMGVNGLLQVTTQALDPERSSAGAASMLQVTIRDNGVGIPPEHQTRLFEPFFTTKPNGTGLGLLITKRIIEEHHGAISVSSEPNNGTQFTIKLPLLVSHQP